MNGISRPWRAGFIGGSGCSVGAGDSPKMQENVRKAVKKHPGHLKKRDDPDNVTYVL